MHEHDWSHIGSGPGFYVMETRALGPLAWCWACGAIRDCNDQIVYPRSWGELTADNRRPNEHQAVGGDNLR